MNEHMLAGCGFPPAYLDRVGPRSPTSSRVTAPELLPGAPPGAAVPSVTWRRTARRSSSVVYDGGVLMGGDRRATMGNLISSRDIEKVYPADSY